MLHASEPVAVRVAEILAECEHILGIPVPTGSIPWPRARERAAELGISAHRASLLALDATFDGTPLWSLAALPPHTRFTLDDAAARWYASLLGDASRND